MIMNKIYFLSFFFLSLYSISFGQTTAIQGKVVSNEGGPITNANVIIVNTNTGTITNNEGNYELKVTAAGEYTVKASYIGYESIEKPVSVKEGVSWLNWKLANSFSW